MQLGTWLCLEASALGFFKSRRIGASQSEFPRSHLLRFSSILIIQGALYGKCCLDVMIRGSYKRGKPESGS